MENSNSFRPSSRAYGTFHNSENIASLFESGVTSGDHKPPQLLTIERNVMTHEELDEWALPKQITEEEYLSSSRRNTECCSRICSMTNFLTFMERIFPVLSWLRAYNLKENLLADVTAGFTLGVMQVPQGMAYAMLAVVPPVYGLYTSFFPVIIYFFMGTSRQGSIGTFALVSLLTNSAMEDVYSSIQGISHPHHRDPSNSSTLVTDAMGHLTTPDIYPFTPIEIATVVTFTVGCLEMFLGLLRMGTLSVLLSDQLISGLICGTAFQVLTSQMQSLTGVHVHKYSGAFNVIYSWISFWHRITSANYAVMLVSVLSLMCLSLVKWLIDPACRSKLKVPFPSELFLIVIATSISYSFNLQVAYDVAIVGNIPTGILPPKMPPVQFIPKALTGSCLVTLVAISLSLSIVMSYGKKHKYETNPNQELLAYGASNLFASFFYCVPCSISLSRSAVLDGAGGKSQVATFVSCILILIVILAVGPLFECLPTCVLSAIIVVAMREMFLKVKDLGVAWTMSKADAVVWLSTFLGVVILDIDYGVAIGIAVALITVLYRTQKPNTCSLGNICGTEIYKSIKRYPCAREIRGIKIIHFGGPLFFANAEKFKNDVKTLCGLDSRMQRHLDCNVSTMFPSLLQGSEKDDSSVPLFDDQTLWHAITHVIVSASAISFIDTAGMNAMIEVVTDCQETKLTVYFCGFQDSVFETLEKKRFFEHVPKSAFFPTIHDAVLHAKDEALNA